MNNPGKQDWYKQYSTFKYLYKLLDPKQRRTITNYFRLVCDTPTLFIYENLLSTDLILALWSEGYDVAEIFTPESTLSEEQVKYAETGDCVGAREIREELGWEIYIPEEVSYYDY